MPSHVVEELCTHLQEVSTQDLQSLDQHKVSWLPRLGALPPPMAHAQITTALAASPSIPVFMERLAWIHCWLMQTGRMGPWTLLRLGASAQHVHADVTVGFLANALQYLPFHTTFSALRHRDMIFVCMINDYANPGSEEGAAMLLVLWHGQRFAAVRARTREELSILTAGLCSALRGESVELLLGDHADLNAAFLVGQVFTNYNTDALAEVALRFP
ncbi:hypothetical protein MRX96_024267 [Rhipicephalus microplus]